MATLWSLLKSALSTPKGNDASGAAVQHCSPQTAIDSHRRIALDNLKLDSHTDCVYRAYVERVGTEKKRGVYRYKNFPRFSYVLDLLRPAQSVLDVGVFTGQFLDVLSLSGKFSHVEGIDIVEKAGFFTLSNNYVKRIADCRALPYEDGAFNAVVCMEVLEHLEVEDFPKALAEIRRVCSEQLIMSVPYNEQPPLSPNHRQSFDDEKIARFFPDAEVLILTEGGADIWALLVESNPK